MLTNEDISTMLGLNKCSCPTMHILPSIHLVLKKLLRIINPHKDTGTDTMPAHLCCEQSAEEALGL